MSVSEIETVRRPQAEPCEECGAPMDPQQRYCVNCAARRGNGANPASRYFAAMSKRARRPLTGPPARPNATSRAAAVGFFALLPLAVALGVMVGRGGGGGNDGSSDALLQALKERPAATAGPTAGATTTATSAKQGKSGAKGGKDKAKGEGKVIATTTNGPVHAVTDFKASKEKEEADTRIVEENPAQVGEDYITAQQNLPDVVVVGGDPGSAPAPSSPEGVEP
ncbi:MAG TPA: hypothetical protein VD761_01225 [Solirubrobacterales bacterium]|nr:hypothetical protein [Solirubrobacterales bacterium]